MAKDKEKPTIDSHTAAMAIEFLKRADLKGSEVPAFTRVWNALDKIAAEK